MIVSFGDRATEDLYHNRPTNRVRRFPADVLALALVKLDILNAAAALHRLEALKGGLKGFHSIRVNDQWRLVFRWERNNAHEVKLMGYHS